MTLEIYILLIFVISALVQRISGIGFSLVALPPLVLLIGPLDGVTLIVINSAIVSLLMVFGSLQDVAWRPVVALSVPAGMVAFPVVAVLSVMPTFLVNAVVGIVLLVCTGVLISSQEVRVFRGATGRVFVGLLSGSMNAAAGVAGPVLGVYASTAGWTHRRFVATVQPFFIFSDIFVLIAKAVFRDSSATVQFDVGLALISIAGCAIGLYIGNRLSRFVSETVAKWSVVVISGVGALSIIVDAAFYFRL